MSATVSHVDWLPSTVSTVLPWCRDVAVFSKARRVVMS
jgi:hypothetical protein